MERRDSINFDDIWLYRDDRSVYKLKALKQSPTSGHWKFEYTQRNGKVRTGYGSISFSGNRAPALKGRIYTNKADVLKAINHDFNWRRERAQKDYEYEVQSLESRRDINLNYIDNNA